VSQSVHAAVAGSLAVLYLAESEHAVLDVDVCTAYVVRLHATSSCISSNIVTASGASTATALPLAAEVVAADVSCSLKSGQMPPV
jgi:hypothetical protein